MLHNMPLAEALSEALSLDRAIRTKWGFRARLAYRTLNFADVLIHLDCVLRILLHVKDELAGFG